MKTKLFIIGLIIVLALTGIFLFFKFKPKPPAPPPGLSESTDSFSNFYRMLDEKILTHSVDGILKKHDEVFIKLLNNQISQNEASAFIQQLTKELEFAPYNPPKNLERWKHKKLVPTEGKTYFGNWHLRSFLLSKEYLGADPVFAQMADQSQKVLISYVDFPVQDPSGKFQNIDEPILWNKAGILPPPTLMLKAQLRRGAIPAIQLHLFDINVEGWMKEQGAIIDKSKQFDITDVVNGKLDDYLKKQIKILNKIDYPVILLFINEFNLDAGKFFGKSGKELFFDVSKKYGEIALFNQYGDKSIPDGPERTKDAWIRLRKIMDKTGASSHISLASHAGGGHQNKAFPNPSSNADWNRMKYYWPGEGIIDFIGMSAYGFIISKNKDEQSLYGSAYYWWQEIKNSPWENTPTFFNEFAPFTSQDFPGGKDPNYMSKYLRYALGDIVPNNYPVSFVLLITPTFPIDANEEANIFKDKVVDNNFYADSVQVK